MSKINYAVQITTENPITNTSYGVVDGIFRWITGRPSYTGSAPYPKWEDTTDNTYAWYENWLLKDGMSDPVRKIDITESGDYGTLSGFNFTIRNDLLLWEWIRDNAIFFTNREIKLYIVLDDIFYNIWTGVISNNPYDETDYEFSCIDQFKKVHKMLPPEIIDSITFPGSKSDVQGDAIPVSIGDVSYAKLITIENDAENQVLAYNGKFDVNKVPCLATAATQYVTGYTGLLSYTGLQGVTGASFPVLNLYTPGKSFAANELRHMYLYVAKGGGDPDTDQMIRIHRNFATAADITALSIETAFEFTTENVFNYLYSYDPAQASPTPTINVTAPVLTYSGEIITQAKYTFEHVNCNTTGSGSNVFTIYSSSSRDLKFFIVANSKVLFQGTIPKTGHKSNMMKSYQCLLTESLYSTDQTIEVTFYGDLGTFFNYTYHDFCYKFYSYWPDHTRSSQDTWWFSIVNMSSKHIVSNTQIEDYVKDTAGLPLLYRWNSTTKEMELVNHLITDVVEDNSGSTGHPEIVLYNSNMQKDGSIRYLNPIVATKWYITVPDGRSHLKYYKGMTSHNVDRLTYDMEKQEGRNSLCDRSNRSSVDIVLGKEKAGSDPQWTSAQIYVDLVFPQEYVNEEFDTIYFGIDLSVPNQTDDVSPFRLKVSYDVFDPYGNIRVLTDPNEQAESAYPDRIDFPIDPSDTIEENDRLMMLPDDYYKAGGEHYYDTNLWSHVGINPFGDDGPESKTFRTMMELPTDIIDCIRDGTSTNMLRVILTFDTQYEDTPMPSSFPKLEALVELREAGFIGMKSVSAISDDFYVRLKGEQIYGQESNTVYRAFKLMLEQYDGIPTGMIDYNNLPETRDDWLCGRQITERKNSFEYIKELASHSFVAVYPGRDGKRNLKSWRDEYTGIASYNETTIVRDSITKFNKSNINDLYNDFRIQYDYNAATKKFDSVIAITKTDEAAFPGATGFVTTPPDLLEWKTYVKGIDSYADAAWLWETAHFSYLRAIATQPAPEKITNLYWYSNPTLYTNLDNNGANTESAAYKFAKELVRWTARQKDQVEFAIPLNSTNIVRELLDPIDFKDQVYTHNGIRPGWITSIKFNIKKDQMVLETTLTPEDDIEDNLIIETMIAADTHDESGVETDQVDDGQDRT